MSARVLKLVPADSPNLSPRQRADYSYLHGLARHLAGDRPGAIALFNAAIQANPFHADARRLLVMNLNATGKVKEAQRVGVEDVATLDLGTRYHTEVGSLLNHR